MNAYDSIFIVVILSIVMFMINQLELCYKVSNNAPFEFSTTKQFSLLVMKNISFI